LQGNADLDLNKAQEHIQIRRLEGKKHAVLRCTGGKSTSGKKVGRNTEPSKDYIL